jgi:Ti-type conjugative transfer relaxase TraA
LIVEICNQGRSFKGLLAYVFGQGNTPEEQRYSFYDSANMSSDDRRDFAINMITLERNAERLKQEAGIQNTGRKTQKGGVFHAVLSWAAGEKPDQEHQTQAAREMLKKWGIDHHQFAIVGHQDTDNPHLHIVANLTDPENGKRAALAYSKREANGFCKEYRRAHGWNVAEGQEYGAAPQTVQQKTPAPEFAEEHQAAKIIERMQKQHAAFTRENMERELYADIPHREKRRAVIDNALKNEDLQTIGEKNRKPVYSTQKMIDFEKGMIATAQAMHQNKSHAIDAKHRETALAAVREGIELSAQQREAIEHLTNDNQLSNLIGFAGAGKSTILSVARDIWEAQGYRVRGAALSGIAAENMQENGITSQTIHSFEGKNRTADEITDQRQGQALTFNQAELVRDAKLTAKDVFILDEAGMIAGDQLTRVLELAKQSGAKIVMVGDSGQLQSIDAGAAFRTIVERTEAAQLDEVRRQKTAWEKQATIDLANGKTAKGLQPYIERGHVKELASQEDAREALTSDYMAAYNAAPEKSRLALAYTRRDVSSLNASLRAEMIKKGVVSGENHKANILREDGKGGFFKAVEQFAAGDRLMFRANDKGLGVFNGSLATIKSIEDDRYTVELDNGQTVAFNNAEYKNFALGYACTVHKSQGSTVDECYIMASKHFDKQSSYVAMSRHKEKMRLYSSREEFKRKTLLDVLSKDNANLSTLDFEPQHQPQQTQGEAKQPNIKPLRDTMTTKQKESLNSALQNDTRRRVKEFTDLAKNPVRDLRRWMGETSEHGGNRAPDILPIRSAGSPEHNPLQPLDTRRDGAASDSRGHSDTINARPLSQGAINSPLEKGQPPQECRIMATKEQTTRFITEAYNAAENGAAFKTSLESEGLTLAPATRGGGLVFIDERGKINKLSRFLEIEERGQAKTKAMQSKFSDLDRASLGNAEQIAQERATIEPEANPQQQPKHELKTTPPLVKRTEKEELERIRKKLKFDEEIALAFDETKHQKELEIAESEKSTAKSIERAAKAAKAEISADFANTSNPAPDEKTRNLAAMQAMFEQNKTNSAKQNLNFKDIKGTNALKRAKKTAAEHREKPLIEPEQPAPIIAPEPPPQRQPEPEHKAKGFMETAKEAIGSVWNDWREKRSQKQEERTEIQPEPFKTPEPAPLDTYEKGRTHYTAAIDPKTEFKSAAEHQSAPDQGHSMNKSDISHSAGVTTNDHD